MGWIEIEILASKKNQLFRISRKKSITIKARNVNESLFNYEKINEKQMYFIKYTTL